MDARLPIRVVVGEDQPLFRAGIVHVLDGAGFDVVGATGNAVDLVAKARAQRPDIALIDIRMPPGLTDDGLRAAQEIRALDPAIGVLVLSQFLEDDYAFELLGDRPEGMGYLLKERIADVPSFTDDVRRVANGGSVVDAAVVKRLVARRRSCDPVRDLTLREADVLALMAEGRSNRGIAEVLVVTVSAVERHITRIFAKLDLPADEHDHRRVLAVLRYLTR